MDTVRCILRCGNNKNYKYSGTSVYVLNPFQILGLIPSRTCTKQIFPIRNKGKTINPFPRNKKPIVIGILYIDGVYKII
jgi:hypothetical protein